MLRTTTVATATTTLSTKKQSNPTDAADDEDGPLDGPILYVPPAAVSFLVKVTLLAAPPSPLGPAPTATY